MTSGFASTLSRIGELDARIRAIDPAWAGLGDAAGELAGGIVGGLVGAGTVSAGAGAATATDGSNFAALLAAMSAAPTVSAGSSAFTGVGRSTGVGSLSGATYRPAFVTERKDDTPWDDCTLASAAMLADYASLGVYTPSREAMRAASGVPDRQGASDPTTLNDAARALAAVAPGVRMEYPATGLRVDWNELLAQLQHGAGAVIQGRSDTLSDQYRRWDPSYGGGHAIFVMAGTDPNTLWVMDPLAPAGWAGEAIPVSEIRRFAESFASSDGSLSVALAAPPGRSLAEV